MHLSADRGFIGGALQWHAHRVTVLRRKCVIAMELQSRYCMVFAGLTKPDFQRFPEIFADRLWREAAAICMLDDAHSQQLAALARLTSEQQYYETGMDRSVQAHIKEVAWNLDYMANLAGSLPATPEAAFSFGIRMNETPRMRKGDRDYFIPLEVFRGFWTGMLDHMSVERQRAGDKTADIIPFKKR